MSDTQIMQVFECDACGVTFEVKHLELDADAQYCVFCGDDNIYVDTITAEKIDWEPNEDVVEEDEDEWD